MKIREKIHRILAGLLAVVVLTTSLSLDSFAQAETEPANGTTEISTEALTEEIETDKETEPVDTQTESGETVDSEETTAPEETKNPENPEEIETPETPVNPEDTEVPENPANPEDTEEPEKPVSPEETEVPEKVEKPEVYRLGGRIYVDFDEDGEQDEDEEGIIGVTVRIFNVENEETATVETDENGDYLVEGLEAGSYTVELDMDDAEASIYNLAASAENVSFNTELPGDEESWELRITGVELSEDQTLDAGFVLSDDIWSNMMDMDTMEAVPTAAYEQTVKASQKNMTYAGNTVYWAIYDVTDKKIGKNGFNQIYVYHERYVDEHPDVWLFCLNRSASVPGDHVKKSDIPTSVIKDATTRDYCKKVAYFSEHWSGWGSLDSGQKKKYHLAAQMLIWNKLHGGNHRAFLGKGNGTKITKEIDLSKEKAAITAQVNKINNNKKPFFNQNPLTAVRDNVNNSNHIYRFEDNQGVLCGYEITGTGDGIKDARIDGNTLIVTMKSKAEFNNKTYKIHFKRKASKGIENACYVGSEGLQPLLMWGSMDETASVSIFYKAEATVKIKKVDDENQPIPGVTFKWGYTSAMKKTTGSTNANGEVVITAECPGPIYVQELSVPDGYVKSTEIKTVEISPNQTSEVKFVNKKKRSVILKKVDADTGAGIPGVTFEYYATDNQSVKYTGTTVGGGTFTSPANFTAGQTIVMTETKTDGFHLLPPGAARTQQITLSVDNSKNVFVFRDAPFKVGLKVVKYNSVTKKPVKGMKFRIGTDPQLADSSKYKEYVTNQDGKIEMPEKDYFRYDQTVNGYLYYQEIDGPANVKIDPTIKRTPAYSWSNTQTTNMVKEVVIYNEEEPAPIRVKKTGSDGRLLDEISFRVEQYKSGSWKFVENLRTVGGYATTRTKFERSEIRAGHVRLKETSLGNNKGYEMLKDPIVVPASLADSETEVIEVPAENPKTPTELSIFKYDPDTKKPLEGAVFRITDAKGNVVISALRTGKDGKAETTELYADTQYYLQETVAPRGYEINEKYKNKIAFKLTKEGKVLSGEGTTTTLPDKPYSYHFDVPNDPIYGRIEIDKKDNNGRPLDGIEFTIYKNFQPYKTIKTVKGHASSGDLLADGVYQVQETYCPPEYNITLYKVPSPTFDFLAKSPELYAPTDGESGGWKWHFDKEKLTMTYVIENQEKVGTVKVKKVDSEDKNIVVKGATIRLVNQYTGVTLQTKTTRADGWAYFYNVPLVNPMVSTTQGYYYVEEITPGENHVLPKNTKKYFSLTVENQDQEPTKTVTFENPPVRGNVVITKVDKENPSKKLEGAEFAVYEAEAYEKAVAAHQTPIAIVRKSTGTNGQAEFNLRYGNYIIKETKASKYHYNDLENGGLSGSPEGVTYDKKVQGYRLTISEHGKTIPFTVENPRLNIQIEVTKYGYNNTKLSNVKFNLCKANGTVVEMLTTGNDGKVKSKFYDAEYLGEGAYIIEAEKYPNYELNTKKYPVDIISKKNTEVELKPITVTNKREPIHLKLRKENKEGENVRATFKVSAILPSTDTREIGQWLISTGDTDTADLSWIFDEIDSEITKPEYTDLDGSTWVRYLWIVIEEIETEPQYKKLNRDIIAFEYKPQIDDEKQRLSINGTPQNGVTYDADTMTITVVNELIPITLNLIKKGSSESTYLSGAVFSIQPNGIDADPIKVKTNGTSEGVSVSLPYADSYTVTEVSPPYGYTNTYGSQTIRLSSFTQTRENGNIIAYNESLTIENPHAQLRIRKVGPGGEPLKAKFAIYDTSSGKTTYVETSKENYGYGTVDLGVYWKENVGAYWDLPLQIKEVEVESNYKLYEGDISATLVFSMGNIYWQYYSNDENVEMNAASGELTITVTDQRKPTDFYLKKVGQGTDTVTADIELQAYRMDRLINTLSHTIRSTGSTKTTFFDSLRASDGYDVYITETSASTGYKYLGNFKAFTYYPDKEGAEKFQDVDEHIEIQSTIGTSSNSFTILLKNEPESARLLIKKIDQDTKKALAGAEIQVTSSNGVTKTITTTGSEEGDWVEGLPYAASYTIRETKAPDGYETPTTAKTVTISQFTKKTVSGEKIYEGEVTLENTKKYEFYINKEDSFGNPAEATFRVEMYGSGMTGFKETVKTVDGKADLTPVLEKAKEKGTPSTGYWYFYIYETETEEGLQRYTDLIAYCRFYPGNIRAGSKNFVTLQSSSYTSGLVYGTGSYASAHFTLKNKNIPINLTVIKKETGSSPVKYLAGAVFEIQPGDKKAITVETKATSAGVTVQLPYADYYVVTEISAPEGYLKDSTVYTYSIDDFTKTGSGSNITAYNKSVTYNNDPIKGSIKISKYDEADPGNEEKTKLMAGAQFEIYKGKAPTTGTDEQKYNAVSTAGGYTLADTVTIGTDGTGTSKQLPYGDYVIKETKAPENYEITYELQERTIKNNTETVQVSFGDAQKEGSLTIYKWEKDAKIPLANAQFQIYDAETDKAVGNSLYTGVDGKIGPVSLPYGRYYIKEIQAPPGYITISGDWEQPFDINDQNRAVEKNAENEKPSYALKLIKRDEQGDYLAGAVFGVFEDGTEPDVRPEPSNALYTFTTDISGITIQPLENAGDYDIYELKAPDGYELITEKVADVHVDMNTPTAEVEAVNQRQTIPLKIIKLDESERTPLAGAVFEIRNKATGALVATTDATDSNGEVTVQVPAGDITYTATEIKAPGNPGEYALDSTPRDIKVTSSTDTQGTVSYSAEPLTVTNRKTVKGTILLVKTETGKPDVPVEGAVYGVYDSSNHQVAELKTSSTGEAQISDLEFGTYTVREIQIPEGYGSGTITPSEVTLSEEAPTIRIKAEDPPLVNGFKVKKVDETDKARTLPGAEFTVFTSWDDAYNYNPDYPDENIEVIATENSGSDGIAIFEGLRYGTYYVKETKAPDNYALSEEIIEVTVNADSMNDAEMIVYEDYPATGSFRVRKTDKDTGKTLSGAEFLVEEVSDAADKFSKTYTTGDDGTFETDVLSFGTYRVTETKAPEGYHLSNPVTQEVVLNKNTWNKDITVSFANPRIQIPITIHKTDDNGKPLAGAQFAIYKLDAAGNRGEQPIEYLVTLEDGSAVSTMLPAGSYELVEIFAPTGYEIVPPKADYLKVTINETTTEEDAERTVTNKPITGKLRIEKKDADTQKGMNGVEFPVYRLDGTLYDTITTKTVDGIDGVAILEGIPYGIYYVKETVPKGYEDSQINEVFRIGSKPEEREALFKLENMPIKGTFGLIKVDAEDSDIAVPGAVYGIYTELEAPGSVKKESYLGADYNLVTLPDIEVPESMDPVTGEVTSAYFTHQWAESKELLYGTYYIKEISSPDDYMLNDEIYTVEIKENQTYVEVVAEDTRYTGSVTVHKKDQYNHPVEGAVFAVYTKGDYERLDTDINVPAQRITTDKTGIAVLEGLKLHQTYVIIEDMAPAGYEMDKNFRHEFTPEKNQLTFEFDCTNWKQDEIIVRKIDDRGNPLVLTIFGLYNSGPDGIPQTADDSFIDSFGNANSLDGYARYNISDFQEGNYYVKELQKPGGQYILSDEIIEFTITGERRSFEYNFVNEPYEARFKLQKLDENNQPLTGAEFELYELDYVWNEEILGYETNETLLQTISLKDTSQALIKNLRADTNYLLRETKAPDGYAKVGDHEISFTESGKLVTNKQGETYFYCEVDIVNEPAKGTIRIQKAVENTTGVEAQYTFEGAEFKITDSNGQQVGKTLVTGEDGSIISEEIPYGVYKITEIKAPDGTVLNKEIGTVNIDGTETDGIYEYTHTNPISTGKLQIVKKDENGNLLDGAEFEVLLHGTVVDELTTVNGRAESKELPYGTYLIRETKAPDGHKFGEVTEWSCEISALTSTVVIEVTNPSVSGQGIHVVKYDKDNPSIYLQGAVFDLYTQESWNDTENREPLKSGLTTDEKGHLDITLEAAGSYVLVETKAPSPYLLDETPHAFTVGSDEFISLHIPNEMPKGRIRFTKTGDLLTGMEDNTDYPNLKKLIWTEGSVDEAVIGVYTTKEVSWNGKVYEAGALICTLKSGETSDYLPVGTYEYQEITAPSAYIPSTVRYQVIVTAETVTTLEPAGVNLINVHAQAEIELYKTFSDAKNLTSGQLEERYAKVKFGVYTDQDIRGADVTIPMNTLVEVFGVDETGKSSFTSQKLPEGAYYVRELETAEGYLLDQEEYSFLLKYHNEDVKIQISTEQEPIVNEPLHGVIQIVKVGPAFTGVNAIPGPENRWTVNKPAYTETEISGGSFEIRTKNAVEIDGESFEANTVVDTVEGGESSRELPLGSYTVTEISPPEGYVKTDKVYDVELTTEADVQEIIIEELRIPNEKATVQIPVYKSFFGLTDEEAAALYPQVYFGVYTAEEIRGTGESAVLGKDMLVNLIQIGENGVGTLDDHLPVGKYYMKELATAEGYQLSEDIWSFTVEAGSKGLITVEGISEDHAVINYPEGGAGFAFRKIDERNKPLAGAVFTLYWCKNTEEGHIHSELAGTDGSCWVEIGKGLSKTSGADGIVDFGNLPNGDYQLKETQAPDGYELPEGQWRIHVDSEAVNQIKIEACGENTPPAFRKAEDTATYQYQLPNYKRRELPLSGGLGLFPYMGGGSVLLSAASLLLKKRRKEESEEE